MINRKFEIYMLFDSFGGKLIRVILVLLSLTLLYFSLANGLNLKISLSVLALVLINELFLEHIASTRPVSKVSGGQISEDSMTFQAKQKYQLGSDGYSIAENIFNSPEAKFLNRKIGITSLTKSSVGRDELLKQAISAATYLKGDYITPIDLYTSYLLLSETETHFLQNNNLNNDDVLNVLYWTRREYNPDNFETKKIKFTGEGAFDSLVYAWNYELKKYSIDITSRVLSTRFPPTIIGREKEYKELLVVLSRHASSNAIIVGESGTGKRSIVEYLAFKSFLGDVSSEISHRKVFELLVDKLIAGVSSRGELEDRLNILLSEITHSGNAIILIPNIENIYGGGGFDFDLTGILDEYLSSDRIKIVGTTTPSGFANYIQARATSQDLFEQIQFPELLQGATLLFLTEKAQEIEAKYGIEIKYSALKQCVNLSEVFFADRFSPGRDVDLLENVCSKARLDKKRVVTGDDVISQVQSKTNIILKDPDDAEKDKLIHLEDKLHGRVIGQDEAVSAIADAMRRVRSGFANESRPIASFLFLGPTGVGKTETTKVLAGEYFGNREAMIRLDMSEYQTQDQIDKILGSKSGFQENTLVDLVEKTPFSLILLDEFEKANPQLLNLFLQVLDEGRLTDNHGKTVSFKNTIIIATSNAGSELLRERQNVGEGIEKKDLIDYLLKDNLFKPELLNRFDEIVVFKFLNEKEIRQVAALLLQDSLNRLEDNQIKISFDDSVIEKISKSATDPEFGARNVRRYITDNIESYLSKEILENRIIKGSAVTLSVDESGNFIVR